MRLWQRLNNNKLYNTFKAILSLRGNIQNQKVLSPSLPGLEIPNGIEGKGFSGWAPGWDMPPKNTRNEHTSKRLHLLVEMGPWKFYKA